VTEYYYLRYNMADIFVPNIIITQDYNLIKKIMESKYLDVAQKFDESKAILLSNRQNKYVYGLEHSINFNGADAKILLKIIDTDSDFENKFFNETFLEKILNDQVTNYIKNKTQISEFGNYFNKILNSQIRIYVAYGIGNDLSNWSNPIVCTLVGGNIELANNGLRTYTYEFIPEVNYFFRYQTIKPDLNNPNDDFTLNLGGSFLRTKVDLLVQKPDYSKVTKNIKTLLTKFVSKVTNTNESNVITLIPDLEGPKTSTLIQETSGLSIFERGLWDNITKSTKEFLLDTADKISLKGKIEPVDERLIRVKWDIDLYVAQFYKQYFKSIEVNLPNINPVATLAGDQYSNTPQGQQVAGEMDTRLAKSNKDKEAITLSLVSIPDPNTTNQSSEPQLPDWYKAIQNVFTGIASLYRKGDTYVSPNISFESDTLLLKLFHKYKMIADPTVPCVIVGDRQMVLDFIYRNQVPINKTLDVNSKFTINKDDSLYEVFKNKDYAIDLRNLIRKKKNSSSFNEKILLDELALGSQVSKEEAAVIRSSVNLINQYTEEGDIPVFLNNLKNSNVLSYSIKNTENYMTATRMGVLANRYKTLLSQLSVDDLSKLLESGGISGTSTLTPVDIAKDLFGSTVKQLTFASPTTKISASVLDTLKKEDELSIANTAFTDTLQVKNESNGAMFGGPIADYLLNGIEYLKSNLFYRELESKYSSAQKAYNKSLDELSAEDNEIYDFLSIIKKSSQKDAVIFTNSQENVTITNALLQKTLAEKYPGIPKENLLPLAETIILMNAVNTASENSQVEVLPGLYLPNKNFITGKIMDYAAKFFIEVSLKTLPFFYLSNYRVISQPAFFYSKKLNISNYNDLNIFDFFSGDYRIMGFKHVISTRECYSEFLLNKANALGGELKAISR
jgi:hypothetical protein